MIYWIEKGIDPDIKSPLFLISLCFQGIWVGLHSYKGIKVLFNILVLPH